MEEEKCKGDSIVVDETSNMGDKEKLLDENQEGLPNMHWKSFSFVVGTNEIMRTWVVKN